MKVIPIYEYKEDVKPVLIIVTSAVKTDWEHENILNGRLTEVYFDEKFYSNGSWIIEYIDKDGNGYADILPPIVDIIINKKEVA